VLTDEALRIALVGEGMREARDRSLEHFVGELLEEIAILARGGTGGRVLEGARS
jgi:hypothetical protein